MSRMAKMVPGSVFGVRALVSSGFNGLSNQGLNIAVAALYVGLLFALAGRLYIRPILLGDGIRRAKGRRRSAKFKATNFITSYIGKELSTSLRDPAVAMNGLGAYMMIPVLAITYTIMKVQSEGKIDVIGSFSKAAGYSHTPGLMPMLAVGFALVLVFLGTSSSLFSSTYSKDGKRLWIEKSLPIDPFTIFTSKLLSCMLLISTMNAITVFVFNWILHLELGLLLYSFVLSEIIIACNGAVGILIDCRRPKLEWKDTVQAVKQNMNVLMSFAGTLLVIALNILILYMCHKYGVSPLGIYVVVMAVNTILLGIVMASARRLSQGLNEVVV
jgi:ABC-2 type transport system permease protein